LYSIGIAPDLEAISFAEYLVKCPGNQLVSFGSLFVFNYRNSPLWDRFDLFSKEEYTSWHDKYRHDKMNSKMVKKQDAIYELILIEKAHCAHLAFLQQGYRNRLLQENILSEADVNRLIPDVLDALLIFHLHLLDRLTTRQRESDEVETISDILAEELSDEGKHTSIAVNAYTTFGSAKERSEKLFESLVAKNGRFADFIRVNHSHLLKKPSSSSEMSCLLQDLSEHHASCSKGLLCVK
ncbi:hypothetical protein ANCCAN_17130, partial [Ancylostoma caninum]